MDHPSYWSSTEINAHNRLMKALESRRPEDIVRAYIEMGQLGEAVKYTEECMSPPAAVRLWVGICRDDTARRIAHKFGIGASGVNYLIRDRERRYDEQTGRENTRYDDTGFVPGDC